MKVSIPKSMFADSRIWRPLFFLSLLFVVLLFATISYPRLSGDEAIGLVLSLEEWRRVREGNWPSLNPLLNYLGPIGYWIFAIPYLVTGNPWLTRAVPLVCFLVSTVFLCREIAQGERQKAQETSLIFAALSLSTPMTILNARIGWTPALILSTSSLLLMFWLRGRRTGQWNWLVLAAIAGLVIDLYPPAGPLLFAFVVAESRTILADVRKRPGAILLAVSLAVLLGFSVIKNIGSIPAVSAGGTGANNFLWELRAIFNVLSGQRSIRFLFGDDPTPIPLLILIGSVSIFLISYRSDARRRSPLLPLWIGTLIATAGIFLMTWRGRALNIVGHERYLLAVTPFWIFWMSQSFANLSTRYRKSEALLAVLILINFWRMAYPFSRGLTSQDPVATAARWIQDQCAGRECVVYADNFWNYWPLRAFTRDQIPINIHHTYGNWGLAPEHPTTGKMILGCFFSTSTPPQVAREAKTKIVFPANDAVTPGQSCFNGFSKLSPTL